MTSNSVPATMSVARNIQPSYRSMSTKHIIGLYGVSGAGKTWLLHQLQAKFPHYLYYEGSHEIARRVNGGLRVFNQLEETEKTRHRKAAIDNIKKSCSNRPGIVAGHFMFWAEDSAPAPVYTKNDFATYNYIIYLDTPADIVLQRHLSDRSRQRAIMTEKHIQGWINEEKKQLLELCQAHGILFSVVSFQDQLVETVSTLIEHYQEWSEEDNLSRACTSAESALVAGGDMPRTVVLLDGDRTLCEEDTGDLFWQQAFKTHNVNAETLRHVFKAGYSMLAFRQAMLCYQQISENDYERICDQVASRITLRPEFVHLLARLGPVRPIIVTCGVRRIWEKIVTRAGFTIAVVGGNRLTDGYIVSPSIKESVAIHLRQRRIYVWAFGDSPIDLGMLKSANAAVVVVGNNRSTGMDNPLKAAISNGLWVRQAVLDPPHRLDLTILPPVDIRSSTFIEEILGSQHSWNVFDATAKPMAKLLMTQTRHALRSGPDLRAVHIQIGLYLAREYVAVLFGLEQFSIPHVQGNRVTGYRLHHERETTIVALMRAGEPLAFGVNEAFPQASFVHAKLASEVKREHVRRQIVLVDAVINSGTTAAEFVQHIRSMDASIPIVIVADVVHANVLENGPLRESLDSNVKLVALRVSENQYRGVGGTDTGHRLFNTTYLP